MCIKAALQSPSELRFWGKLMQVIFFFFSTWIFEIVLKKSQDMLD